jgi:hypothetical protein
MAETNDDVVLFRELGAVDLTHGFDQTPRYDKLGFVGEKPRLCEVCQERATSAWIRFGVPGKHYYCDTHTPS